MIEDMVLDPRGKINGPRHGKDGVVMVTIPSSHDTL
jgi:hypothetical protein